MSKHPIINQKYVDQLLEIKYFGEAQDPNISQNLTKEDSIKINHGHRFQLLESNEVNSKDAEEYEVIGWIDKSTEISFDFILYNQEQAKHYLARLHGRSDGWPLFCVQPEGYVCARSKLNSEWSCLKCIKYFGTTCKAR
jgi:hypothetical protein